MSRIKQRAHKYSAGMRNRFFAKKSALYLSSLILAVPAIALMIIATKAYAADGLIGAWSLDEGSGATAVDSSGNGNDGTIIRSTGTGSPAWVSPGHNADTPYALDFDGSGTPGTASNSVNLGNDASLDQLDNYTISLWVKFKPGYVGGGTWANLVGRNSSSANWAWMIYVNSSGTIRPHHRNSNGSFAPLTNSATVMPIGEWVHIEQVADGSRLHLYINGQEDANFPISYSGTTMSLPTANTYIGQDRREYAPRATISDVKIYNDASLAPQVTTSPASNITHTSARLNGSLNTLGDYTSAEVFFRYRIVGSGDPFTETTPQTVNATGLFNTNVNGLESNTQYEFISVVQWEGRDGLQETTGDLFTFTTRSYGIDVQAVDNLTGEDGDTGSFEVCLSATPSAPVTIALSSSNTDEGTVPASITIQPDDWDDCATNTVIVTGVNDSPPVGDGSIPYTISTGDVTSTDPNFDALVGSDVDDVSMENQNDDPPGIVMSVLDNETGEDGNTVQVQFRLLSAPSANVTIPLSLSDTSEGTLGGVTNVTITPANWDQPQNNQIVITGIDDILTDGNIEYVLQTGDPTSSDAGYDALVDNNIANSTLVNMDNDTAGVTVSETGGSTEVAEGGGTDSFSVVLNTQPAPGNSVVVMVQPDTQVDLGNGPGVAIQLTFNNSTWNVPQDVIVVATDDNTAEDDHTGLISTSINPSTTELSYLTVDPADITAQITDNDDDNDSIPASEENAGPNGGDGNDDGTPDSSQPHVATFVNEASGEYAVLELDDACQISEVSITTETSQVTKDPSYNYPHGLMNFTADCGTPGFVATVQEYYYGAPENNFILRKHNSNTNTYFTVEDAVVEQLTTGGELLTKASFSVTDGGTLDMDEKANGTIVDPAGLALATPFSTGGQTAPNAPSTGIAKVFSPLVATLLILPVLAASLLIWLHRK